MNDSDSTVTTPVRKRRKGVAFVFFIVICIAGAVGYGYYWYAGVQEIQEKASAVIEENIALKAQANELDTIKSNVSAEYFRCQAFISQSTGDFGSFEYCKKFIEWANGNNLDSLQ